MAAMLQNLKKGHAIAGKIPPLGLKNAKFQGSGSEISIKSKKTSWLYGKFN
jgi:hypothetical protein